MLKLWATAFPVSDKRHPVTTPAALLASSYLSLCPVASLDDVAKGERRHDRSWSQPAVLHAHLMQQHQPRSCRCGAFFLLA